MRRLPIVLACAGATAVAAAGAAQMAELRVETADWTFVASDEIGSQADLELTARAVQLCTDEVEKLVGHRPANVATFAMRWVPSSFGVSYASTTGVENLYPPGFRLVDDASRSFKESVVARGVCFGPHEVTHVLTWESFRIPWANEGFAEFTDRVYDSAAWRCCTQPPPTSVRCDETGYSLGPDRFAYSDLSPFVPSGRSYNTAACFWVETHRRGGFPAIRALLASMRRRPPGTTGELAVQHAAPILGVDVRSLLQRYGFTPDELTAPPPPASPVRLCTRIGTPAADVLRGTAGADVLCGLAGADRLTGAGGADVVRAGAGDDAVDTRDGTVDAVACGPGRDVVTADRRDRVNGDCERVRRR